MSVQEGEKEGMGYMTIECVEFQSVGKCIDIPKVLHFFDPSAQFTGSLYHSTQVL